MRRPLIAEPTVIAFVRRPIAIDVVFLEGQKRLFKLIECLRHIESQLNESIFTNVGGIQSVCRLHRGIAAELQHGAVVI